MELTHLYNSAQFKMVPRGLEPRTLRLLAVRSNQLSYETSEYSLPRSLDAKELVTESQVCQVRLCKRISKLWWSRDAIMLDLAAPPQSSPRLAHVQASPWLARPRAARQTAAILMPPSQAGATVVPAACGCDARACSMLRCQADVVVVAAAA